MGDEKGEGGDWRADVVEGPTCPWGGGGGAVMRARVIADCAPTEGRVPPGGWSRDQSGSYQPPLVGGGTQRSEDCLDPNPSPNHLSWSSRVPGIHNEPC